MSRYRFHEATEQRYRFHKATEQRALLRAVRSLRENGEYDINEWYVCCNMNEINASADFFLSLSQKQWT